MYSLEVKEQALLLLKEYSIKEVATKIGVSIPTLYNWKKEYEKKVSKSISQMIVDLEYDKAIEVAKLFPKNKVIQSQLITVYIKQGEYEKVIEIAKRFPNRESIQSQLITIYIKQGEYEKAIEIAKENDSEGDYQILESDDNGVLQSNDFLRGTYIIKKIDDKINLDPFELVVSRDKDTPYTYIRMKDGKEISSDSKGTVKMIECDQSIQSATRVVLKSKNDKVSDENATFKIKMLKDDEKALKNYKKDYLKTDKKGYISMYDGVRWINTFTLKKGECVLPVVLPDGLYKLSDFSIKNSKIKSTRVSVSSEIIAGLDEDSQPIKDCVIFLE